MLTLVQKGTGDRRALILCYFVGPAAWPALLDALGPEPCVLADCDNPGGRFTRPPGAGGVDELVAAMMAARGKAGEGFDVGPLVLVGWSAGCEAVREQLRKAGTAIDAVIALDGVAGSYPTPTPSQIEPWHALASGAEAGARLFILTHTAMEYVEKIPVGVQGGPFESTTHMAAIVTGTAGATPPATGEIAPIAGSLYVLGYPSADISASAHVAQVREVLPDVVRRILVPWLASRAPAAEPQEAEATT